jgi:hypothetical protein
MNAATIACCLRQRDRKSRGAAASFACCWCTNEVAGSEMMPWGEMVLILVCALPLKTSVNLPTIQSWGGHYDRQHKSRIHIIRIEEVWSDSTSASSSRCGHQSIGLAALDTGTFTDLLHYNTSQSFCLHGNLSFDISYHMHPRSCQIISRSCISTNSSPTPW